MHLLPLFFVPPWPTCALFSKQFFWITTLLLLGHVVGDSTHSSVSCPDLHTTLHRHPFHDQLTVSVFDRTHQSLLLVSLAEELDHDLVHLTTPYNRSTLWTHDWSDPTFLWTLWPGCPP
jgi:hypothetical protein